jgi:hypothetical protein
MPKKQLELEIINKLFLELSQITTATTGKELKMEPVVSEAVREITNCHHFDTKDPCIRDNCGSTNLCFAVCAYLGKWGRDRTLYGHVVRDIENDT